jgi:hypothetical protein
MIGRGEEAMFSENRYPSLGGSRFESLALRSTKRCVKTDPAKEDRRVGDHRTAAAKPRAEAA